MMPSQMRRWRERIRARYEARFPRHIIDALLAELHKTHPRVDFIADDDGIGGQVPAMFERMRES